MQTSTEKQQLIAERGKRIKRARNMANLSRAEMCEGSSLNINTLKGWELGKHGGLTLEGAKKIVERLQKAEVLCSVEWLMDNIGSPPAPNMICASASVLTGEPLYDIDEEAKILRELSLFTQTYGSNQVDSLKVLDDAMEPFYQVGDFVAGVKYSEGEIEQCINRACIIQLCSGNKLLRKLKKANGHNKYNLVSLNDDYYSQDNLLFNQEILTAAPVIWHRKLKIK